MEEASMMKAAVQTAYGPPDVVVIRDVPKPVPKDNEVLVRIAATTVTSGDARLRAFRVPAAMWLPARLAIGITGPRKAVLGSEFAGDIVAVGADVTRLAVGEKVFGMHVFGTHAQFKAVPETGAILPLPAGLSYGEAAALPFGALTALYFLRQANIVAGSRVLINGATGAVGAYAVQIAKHLGARVTAVCSAGNAELARSLGADVVIDYRASDFSAGNARYDVVMDTVNTVSVRQFERVTEDNGILLAVDAGGGMFLQAGLHKLLGRRRIVAGMATEKLEDLRTIAEMAAAGQIRPVIDRRVSLDEIASAHALVDSGRKRGAVVVEVAD